MILTADGVLISLRERRDLLNNYNCKLNDRLRWHVQYENRQIEIPLSWFCGKNELAENTRTSNVTVEKKNL